MGRPKNRWIAFSIHFLISLLIFILIALVYIFWWYPGALFMIAGGVQGLKIIAGVDLVLGPLLTLVIYNAAKPLSKLTTDLIFIGIVQVSCLFAGIYITYQERPVALVHAYDRFFTITKGGYDRDNKDVSILKQFSGLGPKTLYLELPSDENDVVKMMLSLKMNQEMLEMKTELYRQFPRDISQEELRQLFKFDKASYSKETPACVRVTVQTPDAYGTACFDARTQLLGNFIAD